MILDAAYIAQFAQGTRQLDPLPGAVPTEVEVFNGWHQLDGVFLVSQHISLSL